MAAKSLTSKRVPMSVGQTHGRLVAIAFVEHNRWRFRCECGNERVILAYSVASGNTRSCGCLQSEARASNGKRNRKHGEGHSQRSPEYRAWSGMKERCYLISNISYPHYGGRGIAICDRWRNSFNAFLEDMGRKPSPKHSLDRIDPNGHYEPGNVRWATDSEQRNNKRSNRFIMFNDRRMTVAQAVHLTGDIVPVEQAIKRITRGWSVDRAVTESLSHPHRRNKGR